MNPEIIPVNFYNDTLALVDDQGQPCVPMKPIVENMGLDWASQYVKLNEKFASTIVIITMVAEDGRSREMICLPLRKIPAFLYSINPNKVKPELRDKIVQYQEECDEVLWQYWTTGHVSREGGRPASINQQLAASRERSRLMKDLKLETHPSIRAALQQQIRHASNVMGIPVPEMESIGRKIDPRSPDPMIDEFWEIADMIGMDKLNHSSKAGQIAINLIHFAKVAEKEKIKTPRLAELRRALRECKTPPFQGIKAIRSDLKEGGTIKCWVFGG